MEADLATLIGLARRARDSAYAPYSNYKVGAALLSADGQVFSGANIENISFGLTICAERVALGTAVATGRQTFTRIAIVSDSVEPVSPCGACRQVLAEFAPELEIISVNLQGQMFSASLADLLPRPKTGILGT